MVAELEKPTVELRKNILRNKIHRDGLQFPPEVIDYIAENVNKVVGRVIAYRIRILYLEQMCRNVQYSFLRRLMY